MMIRFLVFVLFLSTTASAEDWPNWRGPHHDGSASANPAPPAKLSSPKWSVDIPGRSHGSAVVSKGRVYIQVADEKAQTQSVICFDRSDGSELWTTEIHKGGFNQKLNKKGTWASNTPATDGEHIFVNFVNDKAAYLTALDLEGKQVWQKKICDYKVHQAYGASPLIHDNLVITVADNKLGGALVAFDRKSGDEVWRVKRAKEPNYPSPVVLTAAGKEQLFLTGTNKVSSYDPKTGAVNWEIDGATTECVTTTVTDGKRIFSSGGYPKNHIAAIEADGSGKVTWETKDRAYVPSLLFKEGHIYAVLDGGIALCLKSDTGEEIWKARIGGTFSASPTLVGDFIYAANEAGTLTVFKAQTSGYEVVSEQKIADAIFSTPSISDGDLFLRVADFKGDTRSERLVCFGN